MKNILIVGATSAIAIACARQWAAEGARFFLVARNGERLEQVADDLSARGAQLASRHQLDITDLERHAAMFEQCLAALGTIDIVLVAPGTLPDQAACQADPAIAVREFNTNATAVIALLTRIANALEAQRSARWRSFRRWRRIAAAPPTICTAARRPPFLRSARA